jgi:hypothetical protein
MHVSDVGYRHVISVIPVTSLYHTHQFLTYLVYSIPTHAFPVLISGKQKQKFGNPKPNALVIQVPPYFERQFVRSQDGSHVYNDSREFRSNALLWVMNVEEGHIRTCAS